METLLTTDDVAARWKCTSEHVLKHIERGLSVIPLSSKDFRYSLDDVIEYENYLKTTNTTKNRFSSAARVKQLKLIANQNVKINQIV